MWFEFWPDRPGITITSSSHTSSLFQSSGRGRRQAARCGVVRPVIRQPKHAAARNCGWRRWRRANERKRLCAHAIKSMSFEFCQEIKVAAHGPDER